jgi:hypothetical protein
VRHIHNTCKSSEEEVITTQRKYFTKIFKENDSPANVLQMLCCHFSRLSNTVRRKELLLIIEFSPIYAEWKYYTLPNKNHINAKEKNIRETTLHAGPVQISQSSRLQIQPEPTACLTKHGKSRNNKFLVIYHPMSNLYL